MGRDPTLLEDHKRNRLFQSTRPAWGATSITILKAPIDVVSIHAPRVGRDRSSRKRKRSGYLFQSTRPAWGATNEAEKFAHGLFVSIHAPRVGRDLQSPPIRICPSKFQSTRPAWGATTDRCSGRRTQCVSIHAPRVGRDDVSVFSVEVHISFNPRAPRGARLGFSPLPSRQQCFNPRAPRGARHSRQSAWRWPVSVSIHAPRVGRDTSACTTAVAQRLFQSTRPAWGATL